MFMKKSGKMSAAVLVLVMAVILMPIKAESAAVKKVSLYVGKTITLKAKGKVTWKSSNKKVAAVSKKGVVRGRKAGKATITKKKGKKCWKYIITVKERRSKRKATGQKEGNTTSADNQPEYMPSASSTPTCSHSWEKVSSKYDVSGAGHRLIILYRCKICGAEEEKWAEKTEPCNNVEVVLKEATCTEDGEKAFRCTICGTTWQPTWNGYDPVIPNTGHDFEYKYKKQVTVKDDWDIHYDYNNEHGYESMGERTATCKNCGESFEEVGFDTGVELKDGSQAVIWGIHEKPATKIVTDEINIYRDDQLDDETGEKYLKPLEPTENLNNYALFRAAQYCARRNLECVGQMGKGWVTPAGFVVSAPAGKKINIITGFMQLGQSFTSKKLRYSGGAHFCYETERGEFVDVLVAVGDVDNRPRITCDKAGHDIDYAGICHRCGLNGESALDYDSNPYLSSSGSVHITDKSYNDHEGLVIEPGSFDTDHDGICDGCGGPVLLRAGVMSWNYCNLALFGYGGMEFDKYTPLINPVGFGYGFDQSNWREKMESYIVNGKRIAAEGRQ